MRFVMLAGGVLALGTLAVAAEPDETALRAAMKKIGPGNGALSKKIAAKDATAAADAKALEDAFKSTSKFWKQKKATDATDWTKTAMAAYKQSGKLAAAGKWEDAGAEVKKASATCAACHGAHREKAADGSYKVK